jgi:hypothetical protein
LQPKRGGIKAQVLTDWQAAALLAPQRPKPSSRILVMPQILSEIHPTAKQILPLAGEFQFTSRYQLSR